MIGAGRTLPGSPTTYRAAWILPIETPPLRRGSVTIAGGRVLSCGEDRHAPAAGRVEDLGRVAILPGLVNAHAHLELSGLRGQVAPSTSMPGWAAQLIDRRARAGGADAAAVADAVRELTTAGTAVVGDVGNTLASVAPLAAARVAAVVFHELIGFAVVDGRDEVRRARAQAPAGLESGVHVSLAPHAPYSVSPALFAAIAEELAVMGSPPTTVHLAETQDEVEFLRTGTGRWRRLLEALGAWTDTWAPPACGPLEYLERTGFLACRPLIVHAIHLDDRELARLSAAGLTVVTCPRSARWTGAGTPPIGRFYASGIPVAVGTDSLASAPDLNLFAELAEMRRLAPGVPATHFLDSATRCGARALGLGAEYGTIAPGRAGRLIAVTIPAGVEDVEEYLVSGIEPHEVAWIEPDGVRS